jgi:hypothetical protein
MKTKNYTEALAKLNSMLEAIDGPYVHFDSRLRGIQDFISDYRDEIREGLSQKLASSEGVGGEG